MDRETKIQHIVNGDINNNDFLKEVLFIAFNEQDDLLRGIARCFLQDKSLGILSRLLKD